MSTFKVGDKVKRINDSLWPDQYGVKGEVYTVLSEDTGEIEVIEGFNGADADSFVLVESVATKWAEMTELEQLRLKVAHYEGEPIDICHVEYGSRWFRSASRFFWNDNLAYRVSPEPKRVTVDLMADFKVIGTIDLIDGKPEYDSIKMEKI